MKTSLKCRVDYIIRFSHMTGSGCSTGSPFGPFGPFGPDS